MNLRSKVLLRLKTKVKDFIETPLLYKYPLFISYPRSGAHWINSMMELYFNRPRLRRSRPTFLDKKRTDWMWIHDHDFYLKVIGRLKKMKSSRKILFLYRDPSEVIHSHLNSKYKNFDHYGYEYGKEYRNKRYVFSEASILREIHDWVNYHKEYLEHHGNLRVTILKYENFLDKKKRLAEFRKICEHFNLPFDGGRISKIFKEYGKRDLDKNKKTGKEEYKKEKEEFLKKWRPLINRKVLESGLRI